jgi:hypothetical protein
MPATLVVAEPVSQPLTPRRATWLVLRRQEQRTEAEAQQLAQLGGRQRNVLMCNPHEHNHVQFRIMWRTGDRYRRDNGSLAWYAT